MCSGIVLLSTAASCCSCRCRALVKGSWEYSGPWACSIQACSGGHPRLAPSPHPLLAPCHHPKAPEADPHLMDSDSTSGWISNRWFNFSLLFGLGLAGWWWVPGPRSWGSSLMLSTSATTALSGSSGSLPVVSATSLKFWELYQIIIRIIWSFVQDAGHIRECPWCRKDALELFIGELLQHRSMSQLVYVDTFQASLADQPTQSVGLSYLPIVGHLCLKPKYAGRSRPTSHTASWNIQFGVAPALSSCRSLMSLVEHQITRLKTRAAVVFMLWALLNFSKSCSSLCFFLARSRRAAVLWNFSSKVRELRCGRAGPSWRRWVSVKSRPAKHPLNWWVATTATHGVVSSYHGPSCSNGIIFSTTKMRLKFLLQAAHQGLNLADLTMCLGRDKLHLHTMCVSPHCSRSRPRWPPFVSTLKHLG